MQQRNAAQHSRSSSGVKEPSDINALADEYLLVSAYQAVFAIPNANDGNRQVT